MNASDVVLEFRNVTKCFKLYRTHRTLFRLARAFWQRETLAQDLLALAGVNFQLRKGEKTALLGLNGSGKTTFLRTACGILQPTSGEVLRRETFFPLFNYHLGLMLDLSVMDNIFLLGAFHGLVAKDVEKKLELILNFCELDPYLSLPVKHLSAGQMARLGFGVFMHAGHDFLIFDESTSFGDIIFQHKAAAYFDGLFKDSSKTVLMTSHDLGSLARHCRRAVWLERGKVRLEGEAALVVEEYSRCYR